MDLPLWRFRERDDLTISHGNFPHGDGITARQLTWDGQEIMVDDGGKYGELEKQGKSPLYYTHEDLPDDFHKRMEVAYVDERMISFKIAQDRGFDPRTHRFEQMSNKPHNFPAAGINTGDDFKTTINGLYAVGDCVNGMHGCSGATTSAFLVGNALPKSVSGAKEPVINEYQVENQKRIAMAPTEVKDGTVPTELECSIRYICDRYVGMFRSEGKLREGLRRLGSLRREFEPKLMAKNPHYLMRCLEVRNIMDLAELHILATLSRKETRVGFIRLDYPNTDHFWDNKITYQRKENETNILETREVPDLRANTR
jgi:succinate dehydrogenase/fumarate reductase flavoprotein subunit